MPLSRATCSATAARSAGESLFAGSLTRSRASVAAREYTMPFSTLASIAPSLDELGAITARPSISGRRLKSTVLYLSNRYEPNSDPSATACAPAAGSIRPSPPEPAPSEPALLASLVP